MKASSYFLVLLGFLLAMPLARSQVEILVHLEPGTPQDTIDAYLLELQATELDISPLSGVRLWELPDTIIDGSDTIFSYESPRYASRRPKIKESGLNYTTFIPAPTPGTQELPPFFCAPAYVVPPGDGCEVVIGLIDSGIDTSHSYFDGKMHYFWSNPGEIPGDGLDNDGNGFIDDVTGWNFLDTTANPADSNGHGTHIAGTMIQLFELASMGGPPPPIRIMNLKTQGSDGLGTLFGLIQAIDYAATHGAHILNLSLGYIDTFAINDSIPAPLAHTLDVARNYANLLAVCAAGNETVDIDTFRHYPGAFPLAHILTVSSADCIDRLSLFSNFGDINSDIGAPGEQVFSTVPGDLWESKNGTSMAAGVVSAISALMGTHLGGVGCTGTLSVFDPLEIKRALLVSARVSMDFTDTVLTDGVLNPPVALDSLYARLGFLSGEAWRDDGDGIRLGIEDTLPNIPVWLENTERTLLLSGGTDSLGRYAFEKLPPGAYRLRFGGISDTLALSVTGPASVPDPVSGLTDTIPLGPADSLLTLHAGYYAPIRLSISLFLEGPYDSGTGKMKTDLLRQGVLPLQEPFTHLQTDTLTFGEAAVLPAYAADTLTDSAGVDWGILEWRDGADSTQLDARLPVLLRADGRLVLPSGFDPYLPGGGMAPQFIALRFAGHLPVMIQAAHSPGGLPLIFSMGSTSVTFPDARTDLGGGVLGLTMGDTDGDGAIDSTDRAATWNARNSSGYLPEDVTRDGVVDAADRAATWNNRNKTSVVQ